MVDNQKDELKKLIDDLATGDERTRRYAAEDIGYENYVEGIPALVNALTDESIAVAEACSQALMRIGGAAAAEAIAPLLSTEDVRLRNHAAEILAKLGAEAVPTLENRLRSKDRDVRKFAIDTLVEIGSHDSAQALLVALDDEDVNIASTAADGLGAIGDESHLAALEAHLGEDEWMHCAALRSMGMIGGEKAVETLLRSMKSESMMIKMTATQSVAALAKPENLPELLKMLNDESIAIIGPPLTEAISNAVARSDKTDFSKCLDESKLSAIGQICSSYDEEAVKRAIDLLAIFKAESQITALIGCFDAEDEFVNEEAINAVLRIAPNDLSPFVQILESDDSSTKQKAGAITCVGRLNHADSLANLQRFLATENEDLTCLVLQVIDDEIEQIPISELISLLGTGNARVRAEAAEAMGRAGNEAFIEPLIATLKDEDDEVIDRADYALIRIGERTSNALLLPYINSFSTGERKMAFEFFGNHEPETMIDTFLDGTKDPDEDIRVISFKVIANLEKADQTLIELGIADESERVRVEAVRAISSLPREESLVRFITQTLSTLGIDRERSKVEMIQLLSTLGEFNVVPVVLSFIKDESTWVQIEAVEALKVLGDDSVVDQLKELLDSDNEELVDIVENAIDELEY